MAPPVAVLPLEGMNVLFLSLGVVQPSTSLKLTSTSPDGSFNQFRPYEFRGTPSTLICDSTEGMDTHRPDHTSTRPEDPVPARLANRRRRGDGDYVDGGAGSTERAKERVV